MAASWMRFRPGLATFLKGGIQRVLWDQVRVRRTDLRWRLSKEANA